MNPREKIIDHFSQLSPELKRSAQFILDNEQELIVLSMRAFALKAEVKPATLLRLAKCLGYEGWNGLKDDFIVLNGLRNDQSYTSKAQKMVNDLSNELGNDLYDLLFESQMSNLIATHQKNKESFQQFVDLFDHVDHIYICGFRASFPIAWSIFYVYKLFNKNITLIDGLASNLEMYMRDFSKKDAVIVVGFHPYSREIISVMNNAKTAGSKIFAITDHVTSPLATHAISTLWFSTDSPSFFPSISSGLGISEALLAALLSKNGQNAVEKVKINEEFIIQSGAYFNDRFEK
ncbi:MurR/RpiR family transcriptional regulator [Acinetobacter sp. B10A]|uniref:MurR/RpiR family transcriptional regulator n=1 Tax=Acinetobacter baretiae TaxID=2605383 RepID=UPI001B3C67B2|nr:MurR/RpiR family transcriptional regulator [Acinetobacter baretiae]MBF7685570.1 MurR/RpiR family transcriptional regulator [Acinetobacter baretiae]